MDASILENNFKKSHALQGFFCYTKNNMEGESTIAYEHKNEKLPRKDTRASFLVRVLFSILLLVIIISSIFIATLRSDKYQFSDVKVFGPITFSSDDVVNFTREYWSGHYFKTIPKTSTIFFSKDDFQKKLIEKFPVIEMAYITLPAPDVLEINIKEHIPKIVWCFMDGSCGFVNDQGILYARAPQFSDGVYPIFQSQSSNSYNDQLGKEVINPDLMNRFIELFSRLQSDEMTLSRTLFYEDGDIAFSIDTLFGFYTNNNAKLLGTVNQDDDIFVRDMFTGLTNDAFKKQFVSNPKDLEYIDMRFTGKIFYKFKSQEKPMEKVE